MTPAAPVGDDAPPPSAEPGKWAKWRADLTALGGFDNELVAVPAGPVSEMIACGEALARDNSELLRETTVTAYRKLEVTHAEALRKLAAAERCIRAADKAIPEIARQGGLIDCDYELCSVLEANYDAARAGVTLSADSGGEGGV